MNKILILDCAALCHRAKHTTGTMKWGGEYTGVIYGFFTQLFTILKKHKPSHIAFAWDSKSSIRKDIFPQYKMKRIKAKKEKSDAEQAFDQACYTQFYEIQEEILPAIGFINNFKFKGYEGDDIIASICLNNKGQKVIATSDNDMFQLLNKDVSIYDVRTKRDFTANDFQNMYQITADKWADVKILAGCDTDEVPGISGVGKDTAIKHVQGLLKPRYQAYQKIISSEGKLIQELNKKLVVLPLKGAPKIIVKETQQHINFVKMKTIFMDYGFRSLCNKEKFSEWRDLLK